MVLYEPIADLSRAYDVVTGSQANIAAVGSRFGSQFSIVDPSNWSITQDISISDSANDITIDATETYIAVANQTDTAVYQAVTDGTASTVQTFSASNIGVDFSSDGSLLAVIDGDGNVTVYNTSDWSTKFTVSTSSSVVPSTITFSPDDSQIAFAQAGTLYIYNVSDGSQQTTSSVSADGGDSTWLTSGYIVVGGRDALNSSPNVSFVEDTNFTESSTGTENGSQNIQELTTIRNDNIVVVGSESRTSFYDINTFSRFETRVSGSNDTNAHRVTGHNAIIRTSYDAEPSGFKVVEGIEDTDDDPIAVDDGVLGTHSTGNILNGALRVQGPDGLRKAKLTQPSNTTNTVRIQDGGSVRTPKYGLEEDRERLLSFGNVYGTNYNASPLFSYEESSPGITAGVMKDWSLVVIDENKDINCYEFDGTLRWSDSTYNIRDITGVGTDVYALTGGEDVIAYTVADGSSTTVESSLFGSGADTVAQITDSGNEFLFYADGRDLLKQQVGSTSATSVDFGTNGNGDPYDIKEILTVSANAIYAVARVNGDSDTRLRKYDIGLNRAWDVTDNDFRGEAMTFDGTYLYVGSEFGLQKYDATGTTVDSYFGSTEYASELDATPYGRVYAGTGEVFSTDTLDRIRGPERSPGTNDDNLPVAVWPRYDQYPDVWTV